MSSWFSISLLNPFKSDDQNPSSPLPDTSTPPPSPHDNTPPAVGVKDDFSVLGHAIGRKLRGVSSFLASPPPTQPPPPAESSLKEILGIRNDLVKIGGSFKSFLSSNKAVSEISRFAANLLQFQNDGGNEVDGDEDGDEVAGFSEEVLDFVHEISLRPECWTDFPQLLDDDFNLSTAQKEHASTVERLIPSLADLRHTTCNHLSEEKFWTIYFIFLLPRLHEQDAKILSTPEIVEGREMLLQKLRNMRNALAELSEPINFCQEGSMDNNYQGESSPSRDQEHLAESPSSQGRAENDCANTNSEDTKKQPENDISFSDLEDDGNDENDLASKLSRLRHAQNVSCPSPNGFNEWVQLSEHSGIQGACGGGSQKGQLTKEKDSEGEESNDWFTVDECDLESLLNV